MHEDTIIMQLPLTMKIREWGLTTIVEIYVGEVNVVNFRPGTKHHDRAWALACREIADVFAKMFVQFAPDLNYCGTVEEIEAADRRDWEQYNADDRGTGSGAGRAPDQAP